MCIFFDSKESNLQPIECGMKVSSLKLGNDRVHFKIVHFNKQTDPLCSLSTVFLRLNAKYCKIAEKKSIFSSLFLRGSILCSYRRTEPLNILLLNYTQFINVIESDVFLPGIGHLTCSFLKSFKNKLNSTLTLMF